MASKKENRKNKAFLKFQYNMARIRRLKEKKENKKITDQKRLYIMQQSVMKDVSTRLFGDTTSEEYQKSSFLDQVGQEREAYLQTPEGNEGQKAVNRIAELEKQKRDVEERIKKGSFLYSKEGLQAEKRSIEKDLKELREKGAVTKPKERTTFQDVQNLQDYSKIGNVVSNEKVLTPEVAAKNKYIIKNIGKSGIQSLPKQVGPLHVRNPVARISEGLIADMMQRDPSLERLKRYGYDEAYFKTNVPILGEVEAATLGGSLLSFLNPGSTTNFLFKSGSKVAGKLTAKTALGQSKKLLPRAMNSTLKNVAGTSLSELERSTRNYVQGELDLTGENISQSAKEWAINTAVGVAFNAAIEGGVTGVKGLANKVKAKKTASTRTTELVTDETISTSGSKKKRPDYVTTVDEANVKTLKRPDELPRIKKQQKIKSKKTITKIPSEKEIKKVKETKPLTLEERTTKQQSKKYTTKIPEKVLKSKESFDKYYGLDKDITKADQIKTISKIQEDIGSRIIQKSGAKDIKGVVDYYKGKYKLPYEFKINKSLRSDKSFARLPAKNYKKGDVVTIKVNPNKSINQQIGAIRHELEHLIDYNKSGKYGKDITSVGGTFRQSYGGKGHHLQYDFFEPDYLRKAMLKDFEKGRLKITGEKVKTTEAPKMEQKTVSKKVEVTEQQKTVESKKVTTQTQKTTSKTQKTTTQQKSIDKNKAKKSKHFKTVRDASTTNKEFKKHLESIKGPEYERYNMKEEWSKAKQRLSSNNPDELLKKLENKKDWTYQDTADAMVLHDYYAKQGSKKNATSALFELSLKLTEQGQSIKMADMWKKQDTSSVLRKAQSVKANRFMDQKSIAKEKTLKAQIEKIQTTIKELEAKKKPNENNVELNSRILNVKNVLKKKKTKLEKIQDKIKKSKEQSKLTEEEYNFIEERFNNYKSKEFYDNNYNKKLKQLTKGNIKNAKPSDVIIATEHAERESIKELTRGIRKITNLDEPTFRDKFRGFQLLNMLQLAKSAAKNIISTQVFHLGDIHIRENSYAPIVDYIQASIRTKSLTLPITNPAMAGRTTIFAPITKTKAYYKGLFKGFRDVGRDLYDSWKMKEWIDTNPLKDHMELGRKDLLRYKYKPTKIPFTNTEIKLINKVNKFREKFQIANNLFHVVTTMLSDRPSGMAAMELRLAELKKIHKTKTVTPDMMENAILYALDKTFQNQSAIAQKFNSFRKSIPFVSDVVMPLSYTPGNLLDKVVDYTPLQLTKHMKQLVPEYREAVDPKLLTDRLSRLFTGVTISAITIGLYQNDMIVGKLAPYNTKEGKYQRAKGMKEWSIKNPFNDEYIQFDWLSPSGNVMAATLSTYDAFKNDKSKLQILEQAISTTSNTVLSQSSLQGLMKLFSGYKGDGVLKTLSESTLQGEPALLKAFADISDKYERSTKDDSILITTKNKLISNIPGKREELGKIYNIFGEPIETKHWTAVLFNPLAGDKIKEDATTKEIDSLYEWAVKAVKDKELKPSYKSAMFPMLPEDIVKYNDGWDEIEFELKNSNDKSEWAGMLGKAQKQAADNIIDDLYNYSNEEKIIELKKAYSEAKKEAAYEFLNKKGLID